MTMLELGIPVLEDELVEQFAIEIIKSPADRDQAAFRLCFGDYAKSQELMRVANTPEFTRRLIELRAKMPAASRLISKDDFMVECKSEMSNTKGALRLEWAKLYAKLAGFVDEGTTINNTVHVISVPQSPQQHDIRDVNAWEASTMGHQKALQDDAKKISRGDDE